MLKYQPGTKWNLRPSAAEEEQRHKEWWDEFKRQMDADPEIGKRLMIDAGIWDENCETTEKYREPEESEES